MKDIYYAKTVKELSEVLNKLVASGFGNRDWSGFDDDCLYIEATKTDDSIKIVPR